MSEPQAATQESGVTEASPREQILTQFYEVEDFGEILSTFRALCEELGISTGDHEAVYPSLKRGLTAWKAKELWKLLDARAQLPEYDGQKACQGMRVLVVGAGPVGLRAAIEAALLGAKVDLVEKRTDFSRNNSLHLWPFLINDLRALGAKKFYGKFASGNIDHICIKILQSVLLKVCLIFGVQVYRGLSFTGLKEPGSDWVVTTSPTSSAMAATRYDVIIAADGKQNSMPGFQSKEFRAKLALAITANFVNHNTKDEASVEEISGVAYVYRQDFFKSLAKEHGIELENIVYYKDETHYFVMTAKKHSLLRKGVLIKDLSDPKQLLASANIDQKALERYAVEAATFSTEGHLKNMEFEKNHRGKNDVALFDFTSLFAADNAARIIERKGKRILLCLAGDSLIEPFWPTGSGCARGFLGVFDVAWMMKRYSAGVDAMELLEEREAIFYLLPQTTPERLHKNLSGYTIDPKTRYPNLSELVPVGDVSHLYDTDNPNAVKRSASRSQAQPAAGRRTEDQRKSVVASEDRPKRSKSIEGLASKAHSESPFEPAIVGKGSTQAKPVSQTGKSPLHKRHQQKPAKADPVKEGKKKSVMAAKPPWQSKSDRAPPTSESARKEEKSSNSGSARPWQKKTKTPPPPPASANDDIAKPSSPKPWQTKSSPKNKSTSPDHSKRVEDAKAETPVKKSSSPKWPRFGSKSKKSTSPEPKEEPKKDQLVSLSPDDRKSEKASHPLQVSSTTATTPPPTSEEEKVQRSVADIVKKYDQPSSSEGTSGAAETKASPAKKKEASVVKEVKKDAKKSKKDDSKKATTKATKADKHKPKDEKDKKSAEKSPASPHKRFQLPSLFRKKKSYDVAGSTEATTLAGSSSSSSSSPKSKKKVKRGDKHQKQQPVEEVPAQQQQLPPPSVQARIEQLKDRGVATDGVDSEDRGEATDQVLLPGTAVKDLDDDISPLSSSRGSPEPQTTPSGSPELQTTPCGSPEPQTTPCGSPEPQTPPCGSPGLQTPPCGSPDLQTPPIGSPEPQTPPCGSPEPQSPPSGSPEPQSPPSGSPEPQSPPSGSPEPQSPSPELELAADMEEEEIADTFEEKLKRLQDAFEPAEQPSYERFRSFISAKKSKEIEVAEILSREREQEQSASHPLWLARVIQGLNKSLERLRKESGGDIMAVKTSLEILNTIFSNVQLYPEEDTYRRVRVSCESFHSAVWQFSQAAQFLARSGWVQIDDFIVLPMGKTLDVAKRILDKHLNIVNQMLWSLQLELPEGGGSPGGVGGVKRRKVNARGRSASLKQRESYSTRLVMDSLERIERDKMAIAAAAKHSRKDSLNGVEAEGAAALTDGPQTDTLDQQLKGEEEGEEEEDGDTVDSPDSAVADKRREEMATMQAASSARNKWQWMEKNNWQQQQQQQQAGDRKNSFSLLETELYDLLPRRRLSDTSTGSGTSELTDFKVKQRASNGTLPPKQQLGLLAQLPEEGEATPESSSSAAILKEEEGGGVGRDDPGPSEPLVLLTLSRRSPPPVQVPDSSSSLQGALKERRGSGEDGTSGRASATSDAQYSTQSSITSGRLEYEKISMAAAAQSREKWQGGSKGACDSAVPSNSDAEEEEMSKL